MEPPKNLIVLWWYVLRLDYRMRWHQARLRRAHKQVRFSLPKAVRHQVAIDDIKAKADEVLSWNLLEEPDGP